MAPEGPSAGVNQKGRVNHRTLTVMPYWHEHAAPTLHAGETLLIAAHGNSQRALVKYLEQLSDEAVESLEIPEAVPWVYELDARFRVRARHELD